MQAFWALPILNTTSDGNNAWPSSDALMASFVIVPILTYIICIFLAWYLGSSKSRNGFSGKMKSLWRAWCAMALNLIKWMGGTTMAEAEQENHEEV